MTPERWQKMKLLIEEALEYKTDERPLFLQNACEGDETLFQEVLSFMAADQKASGFLETPAYKNLEPISIQPTLDWASLQTKPADGLMIGETFLGKYRILKAIGTGGMGHVYQAEHVELGTMVAIKILKGHFLEENQAVERFKREARTAARLEHPNIVRVFDYGVHETTCYLVMEFLEGESLRQRLAKRKCLSIHDVLDFAEQVCDALDKVHNTGVIHRDLKPDNIFFQQKDQREIVKLLDFGIAKHNTLSYDGTTLTQTGTLFGTPHYMSPEQCQGEVLDARSDLYSLGVILFEMLAGQRPFELDNTLSLMYAHVNTPPPLLGKINPEIPPKLSEAVMKALAKKADQRPRHAGELLLALQNGAEGVSFSRMEITGVSFPTWKEESIPTNVTTLKEPLKPTKILPKPRLPAVDGKQFLLPVALGIVMVASVGFWKLNHQPAISKTVQIPPLPQPSNQVDLLGKNFVLIPGGVVQTGRNFNECQGNPDCEITEDETPLQTVTLQPYYLNKYELTNKEYREFILASGHQPPKHWLGTDFEKGMDDIPITNVSWYDAVAYCEWRSQRDGVTYRLPTEAEWEYAARGTDSRLFPWGNSWDSRFANANKQYQTDQKVLDIHSSPNDSFDQSPFGIFAMAGNVSEWTGSDFMIYPGSSYQAKGDDFKCKVFRGGSFDVPPNNSRTSVRAWLLPQEKRNFLGFRLASTSLKK